MALHTKCIKLLYSFINVSLTGLSDYFWGKCEENIWFGFIIDNNLMLHILLESHWSLVFNNGWVLQYYNEFGMHELNIHNSKYTMHMTFLYAFAICNGGLWVQCTMDKCTSYSSCTYVHTSYNAVPHVKREWNSFVISIWAILFFHLAGQSLTECFCRIYYLLIHNGYTYFSYLATCYLIALNTQLIKA